ncbi:hypothetical protein SmJEL517_g02488 [Synchytrium microbalum]|uniref:Protein CASP n=1 Tax=Synchytrium microbalum TaxID=1806994 RepID=A0A507CAN9_9FUNG|nr:uncharacterized protein SmJEL517_g02488 [Synchytrium microbalum]TPX35076.1 hypothetical protein SmJEL517_g02488 [Synchytrium microbalum]
MAAEAASEEGIAAAQRAWEAIGLTQLQHSLDSVGLEIVENQKQSVASRKSLADSTKEFKKIPDEQKLVEFKNLLKAYQTEIDSITKRCKAAESAFLNVYKVIAEAPDPAPIIANMMDQTKELTELTSLKDENKRLREELADVNRDAAAGKGAETSIQTLKQRLAKYEAKLDEMVSEKVLAKEIEIKTATDEKIKIYKDTEHALQRQLNIVTDQLSSLQATHDAIRSRLVDTSQKTDDEGAARLAEVEMIVSDLERANSKISVLERENELLKREAPRTPSTTGFQEVSTLERRIKIQETEIQKLMMELQTIQDSASDSQKEWSMKLNSLEEALASKNRENESLQRELGTKNDYDVVKQELDVLKAIEFSDTKSDKMPLERLLHEKNKKLESELTSLKNVQAETASSLQHSETELSQVKRQLDSQSKLVQKLEEDLLVLQKSKSDAGGSGGGSNKAMHSDADVLSSLVSRTLPGFDDARSNNSTKSQQSNDPSSMIPILTGQRDRYRQRNQELEEQLRELLSKLQSVSSESESLKGDNLKLYEKLRYTQSMFNTPRPSSARDDPSSSWSSSSTKNHYVDVAVEGQNLSVRFGGQNSDDATTSKYSNLYESRLDPFSRFSRAEESKRISALHPAERATLGLTKLIVYNRYSRLFFVFYSMCLHLLVMAVVYKLSSIEDCVHDHERWGCDKPIGG